MNDNTFNLAVGVLALASAAASVFGYVRSCLPTEQMEAFDNILNRSKMLFTIAKEDGLITGPLQKAINTKIKRCAPQSV
ncbi:hypothetical protein BD779DRAFT_1493106 [Infundibulicybe gibba]|nr:hypothetical protein BD779DRAFT_1493106 [Infundibulicybe gibba]